ncbi:uncharacterized protein LOC128722777 [Anopheles nili]|uniref:uncharacterized protein LOC128722777 n=1 Tax=Anopheles nili TaxID=185578 RepID=UPI00237C3D50|nr:uncharacterized protein LOC128722777 [Anopheles nili]
MNLSQSAVAFLSLFLLCYARKTKACNRGFQLVINRIENCAGEGQIITIDPNSNVTLTEDCKVKSKATARTIGFQTAEMQVTITKNGLPVLKETIDICANLEEAASNKEATEIITMLGVPDHCPVSASEIRTDESQTYSLEKYKQHLLVAQGRAIIDVLIKHDKGESCFKIDLDVTAPNVLAPGSAPVRAAALQLLPALAKDTNELDQSDQRRIKRSFDIGGILKTIGLDVDVGGPALNFNSPNVTLDTPVGVVGCIGSRSRRDGGVRRSPDAESLETSKERNGPSNVSF